jgi:hypothetical protein
VQFFFLKGFAQEPYHYFLGAEAFTNVDVYGIIQARTGDYWITTDNGIYAFDGYTFRQYTHPDQLSNSVFNPIESPAGGIYFNNLNGQIFFVDSNRVSLIHQVPDSLISSFISYNFLDENTIVVHGKSLYTFAIKEPHKIRVLLKDDQTHQYLSKIKRVKKGTLAVHYWLDSITLITENGCKNYSIQLENNEQLLPNTILNLIEQEGKYWFKDGGRVIYEAEFQEGQVTLKQEQKGPPGLSRTYCTQDFLWFASEKQGLQRVNLKTNKTDELFKGIFISHVFQDQRGNILLGTFDHGIILIPPISSELLISSQELAISTFNILNDTVFYLGGKDGDLYRWKEQRLKKLFEEGYKRVELLEYIEAYGLLLFDIDRPYLFDVARQTMASALEASSIKDFSKVNDSLYLLAGNLGAYLLEFKSSKPILTSVFDGRSYAIEMDNNNTILVGSSKGLFSIKTGQKKAIKLNDKPLLVSQLKKHKGTIYVVSKTKGLYLWEDQQLQPFNTEQAFLKHQNILDIHFWNELLLVQHKKGIEIINKKGEKQAEINATDGLEKNTPLQIEVHGDYLYALQNTGIQKLDLKKLLAYQPRPMFKRVQLLINGELVENKEAFELNSDQNNVEFIVSAPYLELSKGLKYRFYLKGYDSAPLVVDYDQNKIKYQSIPPGDYEFSAALLYKGQPQDQFRVQLKIDHPFYQKWWFYLLVMGVTLCISILFFLIRIQAIRTKNNELLEKKNLAQKAVESQLKALRSQMNPHFIFNALNSIQDLILQQDTERSYDYIVVFSELVRNTLNYSNKEFIPLQDELNFLDVYLSLEKLRFKSGFEYVIDNQVKEDVEVPPLVIQPFIENALTHGLLHKEGVKKITIQLKLEEQLICFIEDNGIGQERAKAIKERQNNKYESFSLGAIKERMKILQEQFGKEAHYVIEDLYPDKKDKGTKVTLIMPYKE